MKIMRNWGTRHASLMARFGGLAAALALLLLDTPDVTTAASPLYPDLRTLPAKDLRFDTGLINSAHP